MLILIGNSPSSGSTLLADLFDSIPGFTCGPESRLFCYKKLYTDYVRSKKIAGNKFAFSTPSLQNFRGTFNYKKIQETYGFSKAEILYLLSQNNDFPSFIKNLQEKYFTNRGISGQNIWVDKYPENIFIARDFLNTFKDSYFIHLVRNPLNVYYSLRKKNTSPEIAMSTWILSASIALSLKKLDNFLEIQYKNLISNPYEHMASLAFQIKGIKVRSEEIEKNYLDNRYRMKNEYRSTSWTASYGKIIDADVIRIPENILREFNSFSNVKINNDYLELHGIPPFDLFEICDHYGFTKPTGKHSISFSFNSKIKLAGNYCLDFVWGNKKIKHFPFYINPLVKAN